MLGFEYCVPAHQGRAAEHILAKMFVKPGHVVPMNYHFTTTKAHFELGGGKVLEIYTDEALKTASDYPFKGNLDLEKFKAVIKEYGAQENLLRPHGGHHEPDRRPAVLDGQPQRGTADRRRPRHPGGDRLQPDLGKRLFHQAPRAGAMPTPRSPRSSAK